MDPCLSPNDPSDIDNSPVTVGGLSITRGLRPTMPTSKIGKRESAQWPPFETQTALERKLTDCPICGRLTGVISLNWTRLSSDAEEIIGLYRKLATPVYLIGSCTFISTKRLSLIFVAPELETGPTNYAARSLGSQRKIHGRRRLRARVER